MANKCYCHKCCRKLSLFDGQDLWWFILPWRHVCPHWIKKVCSAAYFLLAILHIIFSLHFYVTLEQIILSMDMSLDASQQYQWNASYKVVYFVYLQTSLWNQFHWAKYSNATTIGFLSLEVIISNLWGCFSMLQYASLKHRGFFTSLQIFSNCTFLWFLCLISNKSIGL